MSDKRRDADHDELDDLLQPTVGAAATRRKKPWRVRSQFWIAFFGGALPLAAVALTNARRLGVSKEKQLAMVALTIVTIALLFVLWLQQPADVRFGTYVGDARSLRLYARIAAVVLYVAFAALQSADDRRHEMFDGDYASLWKFGLTATFVLGTLQPLMLAGLT